MTLITTTITTTHLLTMSEQGLNIGDVMGAIHLNILGGA